MAGLAPGSTDLAATTFQQRNAVGGIVGIQSTPPFTGMTGTYFICSGSILGKYAKQLDTQLDDGDPATGSVMIGDVTNPAGAPKTAAALSDSTPYTVCMGV